MSELAALQAALAAEEAVIYGYGVVGAHLSGKQQQFAADRLTAHQELRDSIIGLIQDAGATPAAPQPAYELPFAVTDAASARGLAGALENGAAGTAWDLTAAASSASPTRTIAVDWLANVAAAAATWGAATALPGQPTGTG